MSKKIAVITTTRADYGLLYWLIHGLHQDLDFSLQLMVTGSHLVVRLGYTVSEIEADHFPIAARFEMLLPEDSRVAAAKSVGIGVTHLTEILSALNPDIIVSLGDRFEQLAVGVAAVLLRIPIAHIHGGEITEGSMDEQVRHAMTKMAHLHFVTTERHRRIVIQMGEPPDRVYNFGAPGLEHLQRTKFSDRMALEAMLQFKLTPPTILVTYHPETVQSETSTTTIQPILEAIDQMKLRAIFTAANADPTGQIINKEIEEFVKSSTRYRMVPSLGYQTYLSLLREIGVVLGNSSSGLIEVPSFRKPTVNVGERQRGRPKAPSVIDCPMETSAIMTALDKALSRDFMENCCRGINPYGEGNFSQNVLSVLRSLPGKDELLRKRFYCLSDEKH